MTTLEKVETLLEANPLPQRISMFQLRYFVIGKEYTLQAQLRKCIAEIEARRQSLQNFNLAISDANDQMELLEIEMLRLAVIRCDGLNNVEKELLEKEKKVKSRQLNRKKEALVAALKDVVNKKKECEEETEYLMELFKGLESKEKLKPFDDIETNINIWNAKLTEELKLQLLLRKPLDIEILKTCLSLPNETPIKKEVQNILEQCKPKEIQAKLKHQELNG